VVARARFEESLALARALADRGAEAWALHGLGRIAYFDGDAERAAALGALSLAVAEETGDEWLIAWALHLLGLAAQIAGAFPLAREHYARSLAFRERIGYQEGIAILHFLLGCVAYHEGAIAEAIAHQRDHVRVLRALGYRWQFAMALAAFAGLAAATGAPRCAVRLGSASSALCELHHIPLFPPGQVLLADGLARAREALDADAFAAAWAEGRSLSLEECLAEALDVEPASAAPASPLSPATTHGLTPAERQILRLLARGRTTREIAAELVVAVSTVDRHLTHIYAKLGVRNRAEATAVALQNDLA
jgi:non-specific serine/threonine protein kinase